MGICASISLLDIPQCCGDCVCFGQIGCGCVGVVVQEASRLLLCLGLCNRLLCKNPFLLHRRAPGVYCSKDTLIVQVWGHFSTTVTQTAPLLFGADVFQVVSEAGEV